MLYQLLMPSATFLTPFARPLLWSHLYGSGYQLLMPSAMFLTPLRFSILQDIGSLKLATRL
jgi:hypothetical protein